MKTELLNSYSSASLAVLARSDSSLSLSQFDYDNNPGGPEGFTAGDETPSKCQKVGSTMKEWWKKTCRRKTVKLLLVEQNRFELYFKWKKI